MGDDSVFLYYIIISLVVYCASTAHKKCTPPTNKEPKSPEDWCLVSPYMTRSAPSLTEMLAGVRALTEVSTNTATANVCFWEGEGKLMRSTVASSRVLSVKCQRNAKCLSKTVSAFCGLAASHVSWRRLEDVSFYISAPQQLSGQQTFTQPLLSLSLSLVWICIGLMHSLTKTLL